MKETIKKIIASVMAMATISIFFGGCSKQDTSSNFTPITSSISTSYTSSTVSSSITPGADTSTDVTDNSLFHWVEEPAGSEAAVTAFEFRDSNDCQVETANNNEYDLPVYIKDSERYMHAGNLLLQLDEDGGFVNEEDEMLVRHIHEPYTASGAKIYLYRNTEAKPGEKPIKQLCQDNLADNEAISKDVDKFWNTLGGQVPTEHDPYVVGDDPATIPDNALVWYNGIATDARAINSMIPLKVLTKDFMNILSYTKTESGYVFNLYTGIGIVGVRAIKSDVWTFSYSLPGNCRLEQSDVILPSTAISVKGDDNDVYVSADVLTQVFSYFVFTFKNVDMGDGSTESIAVIVTDNQDILKSSQSSDTTDGSSNSDTSSDTSDTSDTHEPTSEPTSSSSGSTGGNTSTPNTSKPTSSSSQPNTSKPTGETSKPTTSTSTPVTSTWNPDAPGNKPGPYGGYYDASGTLHVKKADMPKDSEGYPLKSYTDEVGQPRMSKADKEAYDAETQRLWQGGVPDTSGLDLSGWTW